MLIILRSKLLIINATREFNKYAEVRIHLNCDELYFYVLCGGFFWVCQCAYVGIDQTPWKSVYGEPSNTVVVV